MKNPLRKNNKRVGKSGTLIIGGIDADDHLASFNIHERAEIFEKMHRAEPQARKIYQAVVSPIKSAFWDIPPLSEDPDDIKASALMKQILFKDLNWSKKKNEIFTFIRHGHSVFEIIHKNKENKEFGSYTGLAGMAFRAQSTLSEWHHNTETGEVEWIKQFQSGDVNVAGIEIPADSLLIFINEPTGDDHGFSFYRPGFGPFQRKTLIKEMTIIGIEKAAIPTPVATVPSKIQVGSEEYNAAEDILRGFTGGEDAFLMIPEGWGVELKTNTFDPSNVIKAAKAEDEEMAGLILAGFLEFGLGGNSGNNALQVSGIEFFRFILELIAEVALDVINNRLIPNLMRLNFGDKDIKPPQMTVSGISEKAGKEFMEVVTGYISSGAVTVDETLEDFLRRIHKLPKKAAGEITDNGKTTKKNETDNQRSEQSGNGVGTSNRVRPDNEGTEANADGNNQATQLKLSEHGPDHRHICDEGFETGGSIDAGEGLHQHRLADGGMTSADRFGAGHTHTEPNGTVTSGPVELSAHRKKDKEKDRKFADREPKNPKQLIDRESPNVAELMRVNMTQVADKYIADLLRNYSRLSDKEKLKATRGLNFGFKARFKRQLQGEFADIAQMSIKMARSEVPNKKNVKLSDWTRFDANIIALAEENNTKFSDVSNLPRRLQTLLANEAELHSEKLSTDVTEVVAFQFNTSESSTKDAAVIRQDVEEAALKKIESGAVTTAANNVTSLIINEARNTFFFEQEVLDEIESFTYMNSSPVAAICIRLRGVTFATNNAEMLRHAPPNHHSCKSWLRANLKTNKKNPTIESTPGLTDKELKSITLSCCSYKGKSNDV